MNEEQRIRELHAYGILDSLPEKEFNDIVELASALCNVEIAQITLVDSKRQWLKAYCGMANQNTPRELCFCSHALNNPNGILEVPDSLLDERFVNNPFVQADPKIRFYAGYPLVTPTGNVLGTLCIIDTKPRTVTEEERRVLKILAGKVMEYFQIRKEMKQLREQLDDSLNQLNQIKQEIKKPESQTLFSNWQLHLPKQELLISPALRQHLAMETGRSITIKLLWSFIHPEDKKIVLKAFLKAWQEKKTQHITHRIKTPSTSELWLESQLEVSMDNDGAVVQINGVSIDVTLKKQYARLLEQVLFSISHVIRKPVSSLQGLIHLLINHETPTEEVIHNYSLMFKKEVDELDRYTSNLTRIFLSKQENNTQIR